MSWFSNIVDNWFGIDLGPSEEQKAAINTQTALLAQSAADARAASDKALKAQSDANLIAEAASRPLVDSESVRSSEDDRKRKLMSGSSFGIGLPSTFGAPPVGFRTLSGQ